MQENKIPSESKSNESDKKHVDRPKGNENNNKSKEMQGKSSPKKSVLSPKKQANVNLQPVVIVNKSPVKQPTGKDEKKDLKPELGKQSENKPPVATPNTGNTEKQQVPKKP